MTDPRLYILMRTDLASMNAGKGMAQAAHAANMFTADMNHSINCDPGPCVSKNNAAYLNWRGQTSQMFGTTITLAAPSDTIMYAIVEGAIALEYPAGIVHDPTYPVTDGEVTHMLPVDTCGYVFVADSNHQPPGMPYLQLHP